MTTFNQLWDIKLEAAAVRTENKDGYFGVIFPDGIDDMVKFGIGSSNWHVAY
jgi:hypothetical protein